MLPSDKALVSISGQLAIKADKAFYFKGKLAHIKKLDYLLR